MSQEQQPIRSRRELRRARGERLEQHPDGNLATPEGQAPGADLTGRTDEAARSRIRRAADAPVDGVPTVGSAERSSQIRARDRAALRAIKELADKEEQLAGGGPPTRRQLRLQQLKEEVAPSTSMIPVVDGVRVTAGPSSLNASQQPQAAPPTAGAGSVDAGPAAPSAESLPPGVPKAAPPGMTVEQALAARELIAAQAQNQLAKMEHIAAEDPEAVDPGILAEQIALAERAAVLNKRALAKQKLAEQNNRQAPAATGPTAGPSTANNLAMVTPLEFVNVPGVDRPVMKPPTTTFVPVVTSPGQKLAGKTRTRPGKDGGTADGSPNGAPALSGRARVLARAEAVAKASAGRSDAARRGTDAVRAPLAPPMTAAEPAASAEQGEPPRVAASSAYGLEPLDAVTAGLGRAQRFRLLQLGVLALGIVALIAGVIMIISGLSR